MQHDYYKEYYELERNHWWFVAREGILSNYIQQLIKQEKLPSADLKILNVGCGPGRSSEYLSKFGKVTSIEYDKFCCEFASEKTGLEIINGSITELPFSDNSFDLVCAFDVIEHVEDDQLAINELKRVTKNESLILITVPAFMSLWSHHDVINHHFKRYKIKEVNQLFDSTNNGNKVFDTYFNSFLFLPIYFFRKVSNLLKLGQKRKGSGSDFEAFKPGILNTILYKVMSFESGFINRKKKFPFGVSILYNWKKN
jgi:SAM-dependent methyltransferase